MDEVTRTHAKHRFYDIYGMRDQVWKFRVFVVRLRILDLEAATKELGLQRALAALNERDKRRRSERRHDDVATADEYYEALHVLADRIGQHQWRMLRAHMNANELTMTAGELAKAGGYRKFSTANAHYGKLGHMVAGVVGFNPDYTLETGTNEDAPAPWTFALAEGKYIKGYWRWRMHPELAEAVRRYGEQRSLG